MHDSIRLEDLGIPTVPVATDVFQTAARTQAAALGRPDFDALYVAHPIQDQTRDEITRLASRALEAVTNRLTGK